MHIPLQVPEEAFVKDELIAQLTSRGVDTRPVLTGNFLDQPSARRYVDTLEFDSGYAAATEIAANSFLVGCHPSLTDVQVKHLCDSISQSAELARR